jgi:multidrug efflux system membrane fusion protein
MLVLAAGALVSCKAAAPPPPQVPAVTTAPVIEREINEWDEFTGRLEAIDAVEIRPRVSGFIERVAFAEGKEVRKGDLLFVIDARPYAAELSRAEAALTQAVSRSELAEKDVERARRLVEAQAISREEFDSRASGQVEAKAAIESAKAAVTTARLNMEWTQVRAPISGRVGSAAVREGSLVQAGPPSSTLLTTVVTVDPIYVTFDADEQIYLRYAALARAGTRPNGRDARNPAELALANEDGFPHKGYVDFIDNTLNAQTGTIRARAVFGNKDRAFTPGLFARVRLVGSGRFKAILVRDAAIGTDQDKKFVLVIKPDGTVDYRPIVPGRLVDGLRVVQSGLKAGDRIIVNGLQRVRPGMKVNAKDEPMQPDTSAAVTR